METAYRKRTMIKYYPKNYERSVLNGYQQPYSVIYSNATEGYLRIWVTGDLYQRIILISDNLDRVSGYAYYDWGEIEQLKSKSNIMAKWPVSVRPGGYTYNYEYEEPK